MEDWRVSGRILAPKRVLGGVQDDFEGVLSQKSSQHGPNLCPKMAPSWNPYRSKIDPKINQKKRCLLRSVFGKILNDFGSQNGAKLIPKWHPKSILYWKSHKAEKLIKINWFQWFGVPSVPKSMNNRSKIDFNLKPKMKCLLASILEGFWSVSRPKLGGKTEQNPAKFDVKMHEQMNKVECLECTLNRFSKITEGRRGGGPRPHENFRWLKRLKVRKY